MRNLKFSAMALLVLAAGGCSIQEDIVRLDLRLATVESGQADIVRRMDGIEARIAEFGKQGASQDDQLRGQYAETRAALASLRTDLNRLGGRVEESEYALGRKLKQVDASGDRDRLEARLQRIETYLDLEPTHASAPNPDAHGQMPPAPVGGAGVAIPPAAGSDALPDDPEALYQMGKRDFDRGAFETARTAFQRLLERHPKDKSADNAQFWLGEMYYREQWYEKAILEYQKVIEKYAGGNKVAASLLKQGLAFFNLGDKENASLILKELIRKHPKSNEAQIARQKVKGMN